MSLELREEIISTFSHAEADAQGFLVPISLVFLNRVIRFGGEYKKPHLRLFNKKYGTFNTNAVHEGVVLQGTIKALKNHILHYSYRTIHHYLEKFNGYTTAAAQSLHAKKRKGAAIQSIVRLPLTFIKIYLIKGCIFDGYPGFVWSLLSSFYPVVKFIKLYELNKKRSSGISSKNQP